MTLYLITRPNCGWDENEAMVVRAKDAAQAREIAAKYSERSGDEPPSDWTSPAKSTIVQIKSVGPACVIKAVFNAG